MAKLQRRYPVFNMDAISRKTTLPERLPHKRSESPLFGLPEIHKKVIARQICRVKLTTRKQVVNQKIDSIPQW
jgi:hypothetical protein